MTRVIAIANHKGGSRQDYLSSQYRGGSRKEGEAYSPDRLRPSAKPYFLIFGRGGGAKDYDSLTSEIIKRCE